MNDSGVYHLDAHSLYSSFSSSGSQPFELWGGDQEVARYMSVPGQPLPSTMPGVQSNQHYFQAQGPPLQNQAAQSAHHSHGNLPTAQPGMPPAQHPLTSAPPPPEPFSQPQLPPRGVERPVQVPAPLCDQPNGSLKFQVNDTVMSVYRFLHSLYSDYVRQQPLLEEFFFRSTVSLSRNPEYAASLADCTEMEMLEYFLGGLHVALRAEDPSCPNFNSVLQELIAHLRQLSAASTGRPPNRTRAESLSSVDSPQSRRSSNGLSVDEGTANQSPAHRECRILERASIPSIDSDHRDSLSGHVPSPSHVQPVAAEQIGEHIRRLKLTDKVTL